MKTSLTEEVNRLARMSTRPVNLREVLNTLEPRRIAKFIQSEVPVRMAERIKWIEEIPDWHAVPELREVHECHMTAIRELRTTHRFPTLDVFTGAVRRSVRNQQSHIPMMAQSMVQLRQERGEAYGPEFADPFLNAFFLNRIGSNVLMSQYLACVGQDTAIPTFIEDAHTNGIVDPFCDAAELCRKAARDVKRICLSETGDEPDVRVEAFSAVGDDKGVPKFSYIPSFLTYVIRELLKNSCKATIDSCGTSESLLKERPISVVISADASHVAIRVSDRARGIPRDAWAGVWSYLYSTSRRTGGGPSELCGYGVGLPLSRLYARYLGGSLDLVSLPGYGTDAYLMLPRLATDQLEVVPDIHRKYIAASLIDHIL